MRVPLFDMEDIFGIAISGRLDFRKMGVNQRFARLHMDMKERGVEHSAKHRGDCAISDRLLHVR